MISIYYDGDCPFCSRYVQMLRLQKVDHVDLIDLRQVPAKAQEFEAAGYALDEGMVVQADGKDYYGADAVSYLATISTPSDVLNRLNKALLSNPLSANLLYPLLRAGRWFVLFLLDRKMIGDTEDSSRARREIFTALFALYSIFHSVYYGAAYGRPSWDLIVLFGTSVFALVKYDRPIALFLLVLAGAVSGIVQMPTPSNHAMLALMTMFAYLASLTVAMVRNDPTSRVFERFAPAGCGLLLVMYFFGVFHKINSDFLNPVTSCALTLWQEMPQPLRSLDGPVIDYSAIYGTFIVEGVIALALVTRRYRHVGIALGMSFHLLLSLSNYAMYIAFSMLTIALHSLFLNETAARSVLASPMARLIQAKMREPIYWLLIACIIALIVVLAMVGFFSEASMVAFALVLPLAYAIFRYGAKPGKYSRRGFALAAIVAGVYFANCSLPYLGLKTAQAGNMFANLRLEAGESNHLVFSADRRPFGYLDEVAEVEGWPHAVVYYDLLDWLARNPDKELSFSLNGKTYRNQSAATLSSEIEQTLHPDWFRKWFHFQPVVLDRPERCARLS